MAQKYSVLAQVPNCASAAPKADRGALVSGVATASEHSSPLTAATVGPPDTHLETITDPDDLRRHGWEDPLPSYVTAAPCLWDLWLRMETEAAAKVHTDPAFLAWAEMRALAGKPLLLRCLK